MADRNEENARRTLESVIEQLSSAFENADCVILIRIPGNPHGHLMTNASESDAIEIMSATIACLEEDKKGQC
jgi:hypothetical protein